MSAAALSLVSAAAAPSPLKPGQALLAALPEPLQAALAQGRATRRSLFSDAGFQDVEEDWSPPVAVTPAQAGLARRALENLRREVLAPAPPERLLARVLALLSHFPMKGLSAEVEQMVALDWAEDLGEFPIWAVDQAARVWRRTRKWRPSIAEMRDLCRDACREERRLADRLRLLAATHAGGAVVHSAVLRRIP
jgi:hypothetical protein